MLHGAYGGLLYASYEELLLLFADDPLPRCSCECLLALDTSRESDWRSNPGDDWYKHLQAQ